MAERYGTIPKKFTKAWWGYFWTYYKWYVIVPVAVIIAFTGLFYHIWKMEQIDLTLTYAGPHYFPENHVADIQKEFAKDCPDVNKDGKKLLTFSTIVMNASDRDMEYVTTMITSLQFALYEEEKYIFIIHKDFASRFLGQKETSCAYTPVDDWLTADIGDVQMLSAHGKNYGIPLEGTELMKKWNTDLSDHYLFIGRMPKNEKEFPAYEAAIKLANKLLEK